MTWPSLESFARDQVQAFIQRILEEEVSELLGRARSERRAVVDGTAEGEERFQPRRWRSPEEASLGTGR